MAADCVQVEDFLSLCTYMHGPYDEDEGFVKLNQRLQSWEKEKVRSALRQARVRRPVRMACGAVKSTFGLPPTFPPLNPGAPRRAWTALAGSCT